MHNGKSNWSHGLLKIRLPVRHVHASLKNVGRFLHYAYGKIDEEFMKNKIDIKPMSKYYSKSMRLDLEVKIRYKIVKFQ